MKKKLFHLKRIEELRKLRKEAYNCLPFELVNPKSSFKVLFLGDSTVVGAGAKPEESVAGRLGKDYPHFHIENKAKSGAITQDVLDQLKKAKFELYDLIFLDVGANDILKITHFKKLKKNAEEVFEKIEKKAKKVVVILNGSMEVIPLFPKIIHPFLRRRQKDVTKLFKELAQADNFITINFYEDEEVNELFRKYPKKYFGKDRMHPSGEGYKVTYTYFKKIIKKLIKN